MGQSSFLPKRHKQSETDTPAQVPWSSPDYQPPTDPVVEPIPSPGPDNPQPPPPFPPSPLPQPRGRQVMR